MARYKPYDLNQTKMIPLSYADQIIEGSFEYALNEIVEDHLDLSVFDHRYHNDATGRLAYDPKVLLKILLYGVSGTVGGLSTALYDYCIVRQQTGARDRKPVRRRFALCLRAGPHRQGALRRGRLQVAVERFQEVEWHAQGAR
jgi:hypothetical protein